MKIKEAGVQHMIGLNQDTVVDQTPANFRMLLVSVLAGAIGIGAGAVAWLLLALIGLATNIVFFQRLSTELSEPRFSALGAWVVIIPAIGGLIVGLMAKYGSPRIMGHGIPEAMESVLVNRSRISPKVAILKPISAAIAIGTGGPFGAEGPIIQTGGALGSLVGQALHTTAAERKVLLACGAAAGMAAIFSTPIAAVILAIELLLFEFKSRSFIPLVIASTLATSMHFLLLGRGPMFEVGPIDFGVPFGLPFYILFGLISGLAAVSFSRLLYWFEDLFERLPIDRVWWPAIGGLGVGIIGLFVPRVLGVGYDTISDILHNRLTLGLLLTLLVCKALALFVSLGSGTSGGLLAPMFMCSAALGASFATIINMFVPGAQLSPAAFALVGMAAVFGAASRASFAFIIFAFEITRDYNAILPLMIATVIADGVAMVLMRNSIMTEKLARRGLRIHQEYEADVMHQVTVGDVMSRDVITIPHTMRLADLADRIGRGDSRLTRRAALLIVDDEEQLAGIITRGDMLRMLEQPEYHSKPVIEIGNTSPVVAYADEPLHDAVATMLRNNIGRLPVVSRESRRQIVGYLGRPEAMAARLQRLHEEHVRERGWLARKRDDQRVAQELTTQQ